MLKRIGLRTIKTAISILICLSLYLLIRLIPTVGTIQGKEINGVVIANTFYNPFFAAIATAYSVAPDKKQSINQAKTRCIASLIGGFVGIVLLLLVTFVARELIKLDDGNWSWPNLFDTANQTVDFIIPYLLVAVCSVLVVCIGVAVKRPNAIFVAILTFLSITVNPTTKIVREYGNLLAGEYGGVWIFGFNRILSTIIGVFIALGVNCFRLPHKTKNKDILFCVGIEGMLQKDNDKIVGYANYKLNALNFVGANCTIFTTRIPTTFMHLFGNVRINHPVVCMSGAALYDAKSKTYLATEEIPYSISKEFDNYLSEIKVTPFKNYIENNVLHIYSKGLDNKGEELYADSKKNGPYCYFTLGENQSSSDVLYYLFVEEEAVANKIIEIVNSNFADTLVTQVYDYFEANTDQPGLKYVKVYSKEILKLKVLNEYCENKRLRKAGITTSALANHLLDNCDYKITSVDYNNGDVVKLPNYDKMFKQVAKMYYSKNYSKESQVTINE